MSQNDNNQIESSEGKKEEGSEIVSNVNKASENENNLQQEEEQSKKENNNNSNLNDAQAGNNYDYEQNKKEIMEKIEMRKQQAEFVEKYIYETGIGTAFQIIFSELISKKIPVEKYYTYTAGRLRQIGKEKEALDRRNNKNN